MTSLQTVVMGLVIVFLDIPPDGYDWIADPVGWVLVLLGLAPLRGRLPNHRGLVVAAWACLAFSVVSWPEGSPATLTPVLGWLFSLPTLAWCFLVCDAVSDAVLGRLRWVLLGLRNAFAVVALLPGLVFLAEQDWLATPAEVLILLANLGLLFALSSASSRPGIVDPEAESDPRAAAERDRSHADNAVPDTSAPPTPHAPPPPASEPRSRTVGFSAAEAKRRARARREAGDERSASSPERPGTGTGTRPPVGTPDEAPAAPPSEPPSEPEPSPESSREPDHPVTGAEVIEKVRRRRQRRESSRRREESSDS